jgi:transcriptional regulator with XRE-family HTH domain
VTVRSVKYLTALVRERRKQLGWNQSILASKVGVQRLWVSQFEAGKTTVHIGLVMRTLRALDLELQVAPAPPPNSSEPHSGLVDLDALLKDNLNTDAG